MKIKLMLLAATIALNGCNSKPSSKLMNQTLQGDILQDDEFDGIKSSEHTCGIAEITVNSSLFHDSTWNYIKLVHTANIDTIQIGLDSFIYKTKTFSLDSLNDLLKRCEYGIPYTLFHEYGIFLSTAYRTNQNELYLVFQSDTFQVFTADQRVRYLKWDDFIVGQLITAEGLDLLDDIHQNRLTELKSDDFLEVLDVKNNWIKVKLDTALSEENMTGWINWKVSCAPKVQIVSSL